MNIKNDFTFYNKTEYWSNLTSKLNLIENKKKQEVQSIKMRVAVLFYGVETKYLSLKP